MTAVEMTAQGLVSNTRTLAIASLIASCADGNFWGECAQFPRSDWKHEVEENNSILGYWEWVYSESDVFNIPIEALKEPGHPDIRNEMNVTIVAEGDASNPADATIPGRYNLRVTAERPVNIMVLTDGQKAGIAAAALECWNDAFNIQAPDDFKIEVSLESVGVVDGGDTNPDDGFTARSA